MASKKRDPLKPPTNLGATKLTIGPDGKQVAEYQDDGIPRQKEERELCFAEAFVERFNNDLPFGSAVTICITEQNDTHDLDFNIDCTKADYLELAAIKPMSEIFGRETMSSGRIDIHELANWIYENLILRKFKKYGEIAARTFLLVYSENSQFILNGDVQTCVAAMCQRHGCKFAGVFNITLSPMGPNVNTLSPNYAQLPDPEEFRGKPYWNINLGG